MQKSVKYYYIIIYIIQSGQCWVSVATVDGIISHDTFLSPVNHDTNAHINLQKLTNCDDMC